MKPGKIFALLLAPLAIFLLTLNCTSEEDAIKYVLEDVSSRISGFSSEITGPGASLTVSGSQLDQVVRVCMGTSCIPSRLFTGTSESSITFNVPLAVPLGESQLLFVFPGPERAFSSITVVALPAIASFAPLSATTGEVVTVLGTSLDIVSEVRLGSVAAAISTKAPTLLKFTVPAGITTGKITLASPAGNSNSTADLVACPGASAADCGVALNLNSGFEAGAGDNFDNWGKFNGGTKILATTNVDGNEVFRGARGMRVIRDGTIVPATDQWRIQLASDFVPTTNGASYTVFAWVRASVAGATFRFSNQDAAQYGGDTAIPTTWTRISWTFTANATQKRVVLDMNGAPVTTFFIDDVRLVQN